MSAETIKRAAALMRGRAEAARSYYAPHSPKSGQEVPWFTQADLYDFDDNDGPHIIAMSPAVALAVADWLDDFANSALAWTDRPGAGPVDPNCAALAVARAYLGES